MWWLISAIICYRNYCLQNALNFVEKYGDTCKLFYEEDAKRELDESKCAFCYMYCWLLYMHSNKNLSLSLSLNTKIKKSIECMLIHKTNYKQSQTTIMKWWLICTMTGCKYAHKNIFCICAGSFTHVQRKKYPKYCSHINYFYIRIYKFICLWVKIAFWTS